MMAKKPEQVHSEYAEHDTGETIFDPPKRKPRKKRKVRRTLLGGSGGER